MLADELLRAAVVSTLWTWHSPASWKGAPEGLQEGSRRAPGGSQRALESSGGPPKSFGGLEREPSTELRRPPEA
eukprot:15451261-Alexandrium_andersonii.AAC.1